MSNDGYCLHHFVNFHGDHNLVMYQYYWNVYNNVKYWMEDVSRFWLNYKNNNQGCDSGNSYGD